VSPEEHEVLASRPARAGEEPGLVVETVRPAVWRRGRLIRAGQIVVAGGSS
jgi:hypothetical protein